MNWCASRQHAREKRKILFILVILSRKAFSEFKTGLTGFSGLSRGRSWNASRQHAREKRKILFIL